MRRYRPHRSYRQNGRCRSFSSVVHHIIGQQISTKAQATVWQRMQDVLGKVNAETILAAGVPKLQSMGMTFRKAEYITDFS